jgi:hypothetical protein
MELIGAGPSTADWKDARGRAAELRRRRTRLALTLAAAAVILVAAPAFVIATDVLDFGSAEPAPESWRRVFAEMEKANPGGVVSRHAAPFKEARVALRREIDGKRVTLAIAPRTGGGLFLYALEDLVPGAGGGSGAWADAGDPLTRFGQFGASTQPRLVYGSTAAEGARQFEVILADGTSARTDVIWVSEPIDAGVYLLEVPAGPVIESFVARDAAGRELARRGMPGPTG